MNRFMIRRLSLVGFALCASILAATAPSVAGESRPFHSRVVATWDNVGNAFGPSGANFLGYGLTTHMGRSIQEGDLFLTASPDASGNAPGYGTVTITAANGDELTFNYVGKLNALTGVGIGTFQFTGGTGRVAGATGGGTFYAVIDLSQPTNQAMTVVQDGTVDY